MSFPEIRNLCLHLSSVKSKKNWLGDSRLIRDTYTKVYTYIDTAVTTVALALYEHRLKMWQIRLKPKLSEEFF